MAEGTCVHLKFEKILSLRTLSQSLTRQLPTSKICRERFILFDKLEFVNLFHGFYTVDSVIPIQQIGICTSKMITDSIFVFAYYC